MIIRIKGASMPLSTFKPVFSIDEPSASYTELEGPEEAFHLIDSKERDWVRVTQPDLVTARFYRQAR